MISLGIRKVVDTSGWDQSFVDGPGTASTSLKRSTSGDNATSSSTGGSATRRPKWNRSEIEEQEPTKWNEAEMTTYDETNIGSRVAFESLPAERSSRNFNPFFDNGLFKELQPKECLSPGPLTDHKPGIACNFRRRRDEMHHDGHKSDISLRDVDNRGRRPDGRNTLPLGTVATWLDSLEFFDISRLRLNRSTSSSPPSVSDQDFVALQEQMSKLNRGIPALEGYPATFEGRTPVFEGRSPISEVRSPVFQGWTPASNGRPPVFELRSRSPDFKGPTSAAFFEGQSSALDQRPPAAPIQNGAPALDGCQSNPAADVQVPVAYSRAVSFLPAWDLERLEIVYRRLDECGFYFSRMTMDEARQRLNGYPVGTFLLRDSSDSRFLFSLSIQTRRGTTSIRVLYEGGLFRLDSDPDQSYLMPTFDCVLQLICHYQRLSARRRLVSADSFAANSYVLRESTGRRDTPILLRRPLETTPASLAHSCRKRIHRSLGYQPQNVSRLHLKPSLKTYLSLYQYDI